MFGFRNNEKAAITLKPDTAHRDKWSEIAGDAVVMHLRMLHRSPQKNTSQLSIDAVSEWCDHNGKKLIFVGNVNDKFHNECGINLTNSTTLDDLIAIYNCASFVIGSSSGPMHLAAYTKTPHIVWGGGSDNIRDRYTKHWNPHNTPCQFLTPMWYVKRDILHAAMTKFVAELSHA
jgi:hypothetical protein